MLTYDNAQGSQSMATGQKALDAKGNTCPGCKGTSIKRDNMNPAKLRCNGCGRLFGPATKAESKATAPADVKRSGAVKASPSELLELAIEADVVQVKSGRYYYDGDHIGHKAQAVEAIQTDASLEASIAAEVAAGSEPVEAPPVEVEEG